MKEDHGNGSGSHGMPHGAPEGMPDGTIKEVYSQIKEHGDSKVSNQYMKNIFRNKAIFKVATRRDATRRDTTRRDTTRRDMS